MEKKQRYFSPETEVIKTLPQGVVCASPDFSLDQYEVVDEW